MEKVILASASPRRVEIMDRYGLEFEVIPSDISEEFDEYGNPEITAMSIAFRKAIDVAQKNDGSVVIGADTVVYCEKIMGKPKDRGEAFEMLKYLSGKEHTVITGIAVVNNEKNQKLIDFEATKVKFKELDDETIERYLEKGEYKDKAGAYAIQGIGELLVDSISGSHSNVVGLSVTKLDEMLKCFGLKLL